MNKKRYEVYYKTDKYEKCYYYNSLTFADLRYRNILMTYINQNIKSDLVLHIYDYKLHKFKNYINISKKVTK